MTDPDEQHTQGDAVIAALKGDGSPAAALAEHLAGCVGADAAIVVDGSGNDTIARLVAAGWTLDEGAEHVLGKRIRTIHPPAGFRGGPS